MITIISANGRLESLIFSPYRDIFTATCRLRKLCADCARPGRHVRCGVPDGARREGAFHTPGSGRRTPEDLPVAPVM